MCRRIDEFLIEDNDPERLALTVKALGGGVWDYDLDNGTLLCSRRWYEILGLDPATNPITTVDEFRRYIHPDDVEIATAVDLDAVDALIKEDRPYHVEFRVVRPDGAVRTIRSVASIIGGESSGHRREVGCITDVTNGHHGDREISLPTDMQADGLFDRPDAVSEKTLTRRERECLLWVSAGKTAWETAQILGRSQRTIEFHLANAVSKLNASNKVHAATLAIRRGIL